MRNTHLSNTQLRHKCAKSFERFKVAKCIHLVPRHGRWYFYARLQQDGKSKQVMLGEFNDDFGIDEAIAKLNAEKQNFKRRLRYEQESQFKISRLFEAFKKRQTEIKKVTPNTTQRYETCYKNIIERFANRDIRDIKQAEWLKALKYYENKKTMGNQAFNVIKNLHSLAKANGCDVTFSLAGFDTTYIFNPQPRTHYATIKDKAHLQNMLYRVMTTPHSRECLKLAFLLGGLLALRPNNALNMRWRWLRGDMLCIPAQEMKMRHEFYLPLNTQSQKILNYLSAHAKCDEYVIPLEYKRNPDLLRRMIRSAGVRGDEFTPHGWRHSFSTNANEANFPSEIIELCLAHEKQGVRAVYDHSHKVAAKREVMQWWGDFLEPLYKDYVRAEFGF